MSCLAGREIANLTLCERKRQHRSRSQSYISSPNAFLYTLEFFFLILHTPSVFVVRLTFAFLIRAKNRFTALMIVSSGR